ncbi:MULTISPECIES: hypothetical protein [unclassified Streptomyces]|uniref:hypothetical protein n=1 Tax=unclassified Streptomyces TaxID=2593676 RepID=UPI002966B5C7|nr:hypothetical protein [Streptomyces sp. SJL17-1]
MAAALHLHQQLVGHGEAVVDVGRAARRGDDVVETVDDQRRWAGSAGTRSQRAIARVFCSSCRPAGVRVALDRRAWHLLMGSAWGRQQQPSAGADGLPAGLGRTVADLPGRSGDMGRQ